MKTSILTLLAGIMLLSTTSVTTLKGQGSTTFEQPFHFVTDDGCGDFYVSGTMTVRINGDQMELVRYEGTAVNVATGETAPLNVRLVDAGNGHRGFTSIINGVFPGVMQFQYLLHVTIVRDDEDYWDIKVVERNMSHCIK